MKEIRRSIGNKRALIAVSGGVDSTTCAVLTHRALGENLLCVMLDDAFMREEEPQKVSELLSNPPLNLPIRVLDVRERFLNVLEGLKDAEEKRKAFREAFYASLREVAIMEDSQFLVQGTIKPDILETSGGIKTQHNILSQIGINPIQQYSFQVIEPIASLYKPQVRQVARYLTVPVEISERQPFPGPGLSVRVVGEIKPDKLESLKKATNITEKNLVKHHPEQYFAAVINNEENHQHPLLEHIHGNVSKFLNEASSQVSVRILHDKATGIRNEKRHYGEIVVVKVKTNNNFLKPTIKTLLNLYREIITEDSPITRVLYTIHETPVKKPYIIALRAIKTHDFMTARVSEIPWTTLNGVAEEIFEVCPNVSNVCYDVTPKPPATIEME